MHKHSISFGLLTAVLALGTGCGGPGSFSGTVATTGLVVHSAIFTYSEDLHWATVFLTDADVDCDTVKANRRPKNATIAALTVTHQNSLLNYVEPAVGEFSVTSALTVDGDHGTATFEKDDANCKNVLNASSTTSESGLIKVTTYKRETNGSIGGTFDITFGDQNDRVTGSFNAPYCEANYTSTPNCE